MPGEFLSAGRGWPSWGQALAAARGGIRVLAGPLCYVDPRELFGYRRVDTDRIHQRLHRQVTPKNKSNCTHRSIWIRNSGHRSIERKWAPTQCKIKRKKLNLLDGGRKALYDLTGLWPDEMQADDLLVAISQGHDLEVTMHYWLLWYEELGRLVVGMVDLDGIWPEALCCQFFT